MSAMRPRHNTSPHALWKTLHLAWWGSLILIHAVALVSVTRALIQNGGDFSSVVSLLILLPALAFFTLKFSGASLLPTCPRLQSLMVFVLVCGLAHTQTTGPLATDMIALPTVAILATASLAPESAVSLRRLKKHFTRLVGGWMRACLFDAHPWAFVLISSAPAPIWALQSRRISPRAPPA